MLLVSLKSSFVGVVLSNILVLFLEFVTESILHGGLVLHGILVLLEVEGGQVWIELEEMAHLVRYVGLHLEIACIFEPDLEEFVLTSEGEADADDIWLSELLADHGEEEGFPLVVDIFLPSNLCDPDTALWTLFPHGRLAMPEEEKINVTRHLSNLFHELVVALKLF